MLTYQQDTYIVLIVLTDNLQIDRDLKKIILRIA